MPELKGYDPRAAANLLLDRFPGIMLYQVICVICQTEIDLITQGKPRMYCVPIGCMSFGPVMQCLLTNQLSHQEFELISLNNKEYRFLCRPPVRWKKLDVMTGDYDQEPTADITPDHRERLIKTAQMFMRMDPRQLHQVMTGVGTPWHYTWNMLDGKVINLGMRIKDQHVTAALGQMQ